MYGITKQSPMMMKKQGIRPMMTVEGYSVFYICMKNRCWWRQSYLSAELIDKSNIYVYGYNRVPSTQDIRDFVEARLDGLIQEDLVNRGIARKSHTTALLDLDDYSYVNTRRDICDDLYVRQVKHKVKSSRIERTYSTPYVGEVPRNIIGMRGIGSDGRLITIEPREDYGLRDRN